ncbi:MAG: hypothetical protein EXQ52_14895 [Bryobacterales bacterium]|nr:hypothetical protein [Bryobacterales bacterium]
MGGRLKTGASLILFFGFSLYVAGQAPPSANQLGASDVVSRMATMDAARLKALQSYSSVRRYALENTRFGTFAEIRARMSYEHPGTKKFEVLSERGPGVIRKSVLHRLIKTELETTQPALRAATRFAAEVRSGASEVVMMRHYREPARFRVLKSVFDIMRDYPDLPGRERWCDRVLCKRYTGEVCSLSEVWGGTLPAVIRYFEKAVRLAGGRAFRNFAHACFAGGGNPEHEH